MNLCPECKVNSPAEGDYLCLNCRYVKDPPMVTVLSRYLEIASQHAPYGFVAHDNGPWLQIDLCDMNGHREATGLWKHAVYTDIRQHYAIWKETLAIYEVNVDGSVDEDVLTEAEWVAKLQEFKRQADEDRGFITPLSIQADTEND